MKLRQASSAFFGPLSPMVLMLAGNPTATSALEKSPSSFVGGVTKMTGTRSPARNPLLQGVLAVTTYWMYSFLVRLYAEHVLRGMQVIPNPDDLAPEDVAVAAADYDALPSELRKTVSKLNNLVTNPADRLRWNLWIAHRNSKKPINAGDIHSLYESSGSNDQTEAAPDFRFKYRTAANQEEVAAFCKPFWSLQRLKFTFETTGRMVFSKSTKKDALADVYIQDYFVVNILRKAYITWSGTVVRNRDPKRKYDYRIEWTTTKLETFLPWSKGNAQIIRDNQPSFTMSRTPWDIVKMEDGMICVLRGGVGYLVYDSKE